MQRSILLNGEEIRLPIKLTELHCYDSVIKFDNTLNYCRSVFLHQQSKLTHFRRRKNDIK